MKETLLILISMLFPTLLISQTYIYGTGKTAIKMTSTSATYYYNKNRNDCNCDYNSKVRRISSTKKQKEEYEREHKKWKQQAEKDLKKEQNYKLSKEDEQFRETQRRAIGYTPSMLDEQDHVEQNSTDKTSEQDERINESIIRVANEQESRKRESIAQEKQAQKDLKNLKEQYRQDSIQDAFQKHIKEMDIIAKKRIKGLIKGDYSK